ncbi:hypothetical protein O181_026736 [Austropuccinia psidii MF-1]|uniref:Uncharacterized protein n=1 Tax=Austropuccinia psidii MF-1 TaxID=1389203 RepID=A0A9Q3CKZ7_9BASI|nr:hypothetical protein [Austropuccinia psidii MF-1]
MDLDPDIKVLNPKDKVVSPEKRHKWRIPELPPVPKGSSGNIPVSVQELVYGGKAEGVGTSAKPLDRENELLYSSEEVHGPRKEKRHSERVQEERVDPKEGQQPSGTYLSPQKKESASKSAKQGKPKPKEQSEGQEKEKGKGKAQVEQALPSELQNFKERKDSHGKCVQYGKSFDGIKKKEEERRNQSFPKK